MADLIQRDRLQDAWLAAMQLLLERGGKSFHLDVAFPAGFQTEAAPWNELNDFLVDHGKWELGTVVNTIFPESLYIPDLGDQAADRLYESYAMGMRVHQRVGKGNDKETYFNRLVSYPVATGSTEKLSDKAREMLKDDGSWNQLDFHIQRLRSQRKKGRKRNSYELGLSHPIDAELRLQAPGRDLRTGSFPCLSHVSLTLVDDKVNLTAIYRNQYLVTRGFGNYVGLARLTEFIATESGAQPGEVQVVATGADPEIDGFGLGELKVLVDRCSRAIASESRERVVVGG